MPARTAPALAERHHPATAESLNRADQVICVASSSLGPQPYPAADTGLTRIADAPSGTESRLKDQDPHKSPQLASPGSHRERDPCSCIRAGKKHNSRLPR